MFKSFAPDNCATANDLSATFAYNPASQITTNVRTGDAYAWTQHFNQNLTGTPNGLNQLTQVGTKTLTHDTKGNVTAFGPKSFTYSSENLLLTGPGSTSLSYDGLMRLRRVVAGGATVNLVYDGLDRIAEVSSSVVQRRYVHGPGIDDPIVWYEGSGTTDRRFLSSDERGSIVSVTNSSGMLLGINRYDEYGQPQSTNLGAFGYTGQAWLPSIGAWYYKARVYEPELGRFLQPDPIGYKDGPNFYVYVGADPITHIDPLGTEQTPTKCGYVTGSRTRKCGEAYLLAMQDVGLTVYAVYAIGEGESGGGGAGLGGPFEDAVDFLYRLFELDEPEGLIERAPTSGPFAGTPEFWSAFSGSAEEAAVVRTIIMISVGTQTISRQALSYRELGLPSGTGDFYRRYEIPPLPQTWRIANQPGTPLFYVTNSHGRQTALLPTGYVLITYPDPRDR